MPFTPASSRENQKKAVNARHHNSFLTLLKNIENLELSELENIRSQPLEEKWRVLKFDPVLYAMYLLLRAHRAHNLALEWKITEMMIGLKHPKVQSVEHSGEVKVPVIFTLDKGSVDNQLKLSVDKSLIEVSD